MYVQFAFIPNKIDFESLPKMYYSNLNRTIQHTFSENHSACDRCGLKQIQDWSCLERYL